MEGSWKWAGKLESFTRHSWMLLSFGEKTFHHIHCVCHTQNCQLFHNECSMSLMLWLVAHRLPHPDCTLSSWIQHSIPSIILFSKIRELQNSIFVFSRSWQNCTCNIQDGETLHADVPMRILSALFCPAIAAVCLGKAFFDSMMTHGSGCGILADLHHRAPMRWHACVRSTLPRLLSLPGLTMTFQWLSSSKEEDSNPRDPQKLLLVRP